MIELSLHPQVYATGASKGLINMLERVWVRDHAPGDGTMYIVSGFGNYNGGVRFYPTFRDHIQSGGRIVAFFGGSTSQNLTSKQVVEELLSCGASVYVINRKRILHAKCYGTITPHGNYLVVSSGNFTGPGMSQNVEASVLLDRESTQEMNFSWPSLEDSILNQNWNIYQPTLTNPAAPAWQLLYDERVGVVVLDETEEVTLLITLSHADTVRINAVPGTRASLGSQYFWLSRDCYDFFPPLTFINERGIKRTYSCFVTLHYIDLAETDNQCRVTFEAENNLDFRLGTGKLRYTRTAQPGDLAAISRTGDAVYELRIFQQDSPEYNLLSPYALTFIGHQGKRYGYISNEEFQKILRIQLPGV